MTSSIPRQRGTCKWFDCGKGYGFIICTPTDGARDVFVHCSAIKAQGFKGLTKGEAVEFDLVTFGDGRRKAENVTGPKGAFVIGPTREDINKSKDRKPKREVTANGNSRKRCRSPSIDQMANLRNYRTKRQKTGEEMSKMAQVRENVREIMEERIQKQLDEKLEALRAKLEAEMRETLTNSVTISIRTGHTESVGDPKQSMFMEDESRRSRWTNDLWFPKKNGVVPTVVQIAESGDLRKMMQYIAAGGDLDERQHWKEVDDHYGYYEKEWEWWNLSALMQAVRKTDVEMVRLLLLNQADPMLESCYDDDENCTAMQIAAGVQNKSIEQMISVVLELWRSLNPNYKAHPRYDPGVAKNRKPDKEQIIKAIESLGPISNDNEMNEY